jgi:hypothetical protein
MIVATSAKRWAQEAATMGDPTPRKASQNELSRAQVSAGRENPTAWQSALFLEIEQATCAANQLCPFGEGAVGKLTGHKHRVEARPNIRLVEGAAGERIKPSCTAMDQRASHQQHGHNPAAAPRAKMT